MANSQFNDSGWGMALAENQANAPQEQPWNVNNILNQATGAAGNFFSSFGGANTQQDLLKSMGGNFANLDKLQMDQLTAAGAYDKMNPGFDFGSAFNTGASLFDTFNKYNMQNEQMDLYKQQISRANTQQDLVNKRHDAAVSAFA